MAFNWRKFPWTNLHDLNLDWIIQTVKTLENNLADAVSTFQEMINKAISSTLTGSGDLTINKTGDVNITGNRVIMTGNGGHTQMVGGAFISDASEQLTLHNPNSNTNMTANYNSGVLTLTNNRNLGEGVVVHPIKTPEIVSGDDSAFAANVGYVKDAVAAVDGKLNTEISNRTSGDAALQSTIDNVIMPILNARKVHDFHVTGTDDQNGYLTGVTFADGYTKSDLDNLIAHNAVIRLVVEVPGASIYFNICRPWGNSYIGFSGIVQLAYGVASQVIGYNGTVFTVYGNNAT